MVSVTRTQPSPCTAQANSYMKLRSKILFYFSPGKQEVLTDIKLIVVSHLINYKHNL